MPKTVSNSILSTDWRKQSGPIDYTMTNDFMFRVVLEHNEFVLRGLISSMLHIPLEDIFSIEIKNPIEIGQYTEDKTFVLDLRVELNNKTGIDLEMQVNHQTYWTNRSLYYTCRMFDNLHKGGSYSNSVPVIHIGFLDFDLFPDELSFYSTYQLMDIKSGKHFNDNFTIKVLSLNQIDLATKDDKEWRINEWARFFKAKTWEELKMLAEKNEVFESAANSIYEKNNDSIVREMCEARAEAAATLKFYQDVIVEKDDVIAEKDNVIAEKDNVIATKDNVIAEKDNVIAKMNNSIAKLLDEVENLKSQLNSTK